LSRIQAKKRIFIGLLWQKCLPVLLLASFPFGAQAGFFSFVTQIFSPARAEESYPPNSQTMSLLQAALNSNPNPISGGGDITIVGGSALLPENNPVGGISENESDHPISDQISIYIVRDGDTLSTIAKMFGVSVNTIRWSNDIKGSIISPGQTLTILPVSGVRHTVKSGDTIKSISKLYNGDIEEIQRYNNISSATKLRVGEVVIVPDGEMVAKPSALSGSSVKIVGSTKVYEGYYMRPVNGTKTQGVHGYNGIDIGAPVGTPIFAAASGRVLISRSGGWNGGYGNYIVIEHSNGTQTLYAHNSKNIAFAGAEVIQGQIIGYVGATGKATGPHVHFEIRGARNPF
jgi:LysM repeat protein